MNWAGYKNNNNFIYEKLCYLSFIKLNILNLSSRKHNIFLLQSNTCNMNNSKETLTADMKIASEATTFKQIIRFLCINKTHNISTYTLDTLSYYIGTR